MGGKPAVVGAFIVFFVIVEETLLRHIQTWYNNNKNI